MGKKTAKRMMVAFIGFAKAYDNIDRGKLWLC